MADDEHAPDQEDEFESRLREIEQKAMRIRDAHSQAAKPGESLEQRLAQFEDKAQAARSAFHRTKSEKERQQQIDADSTKGLGIGMTVAYYIVGVPMMGAFLGWLIDRGTGGSLWIGIMTLIGSVIGITMAVSTINRTSGKS